MLRWLQRCLPPPRHPLSCPPPTPPRPCCRLALLSVAPHDASTLAFSSGTPAAICRQQAWAVKHLDPEFFGPRYASTRGSGQMALPTTRVLLWGWGRRLQPLLFYLLIALPSATFLLHLPPKCRRFNISVMIIPQQTKRHQPRELCTRAVHEDHRL